MTTKTLWDECALAALPQVIAFGHCDNAAEVAEDTAALADAMMAERAKRFPDAKPEPQSAERAKLFAGAKPEPQSDDDWIEWYGGEDGPAEQSAIVDIEFSDGVMGEGVMARHFDWSPDAEYRIARYRICR